jgi:hypothetical protein
MSANGDVAAATDKQTWISDASSSPSATAAIGKQSKGSGESPKSARAAMGKQSEGSGESRGGKSARAAGWGTGDWRTKSRTTSGGAASLADDASFKTHQSSDFVQPTLLTAKVGAE